MHFEQHLLAVTQSLFTKITLPDWDHTENKVRGQTTGIQAAAASIISGRWAAQKRRWSFIYMPKKLSHAQQLQLQTLRHMTPNHFKRKCAPARVSITQPMTDSENAELQTTSLNLSLMRPVCVHVCAHATRVYTCGVVCTRTTHVHRANTPAHAVESHLRAHLSMRAKCVLA